MNSDERPTQLEQLLEEARLVGDQDKITEVEADLFHQFPSDIGAPWDAGCGLL